VLVPTPVTLAQEVAEAPEVAPDLGAAVDLLLDGRPSSPPAAIPVRVAAEAVA
jgi:hypothetical protein